MKEKEQKNIKFKKNIFFNMKKYFKIFSVTFLVIICIAAVDLFISKIFKLPILDKSCLNIENIFHKEENFFFYKLIPNCLTYSYVPNLKPNRIITDGDGLRVGKKKNHSYENVIVLGDSFSFGYGLDYNLSPIGLLEKENKFNFFNLSVYGYSPSFNKYNLINFLQKKQNIKFSKILYFLDLSDVYDEGVNTFYLENYDYPLRKLSFFEKSGSENIYKNNFKLINFIISEIRFQTQKYKYILKNKEINSEFFISKYSSFTHVSPEKFDNKFLGEISNGLKRITKELDEISYLAKKKNIDFYLVIYPWPQTIIYGQEFFNWENYALEICINIGCKKLINTFQKFSDLYGADNNSISRLYFNKEFHFNESGNKILTDEILNEIYK